MAQAAKTDCEQWRDNVEKYFGEYTDQALFVSQQESGCRNIKSDRQNSDGSWDFCYMQINNEPSALDPDTCARRAWEKFKPSKTWSQWYSVCKPGRISKFPTVIKCK